MPNSLAYFGHALHVVAHNEGNKMKAILKIETEHGVFTRQTKSAYTHAVVFSSPRAKQFFEKAEGAQCGVNARWVKDRGFGVTWHSSLKSAQAALRKGYQWDSLAQPVGIFSVAQ
jgi:hypothetical protein